MPWLLTYILCLPFKCSSAATKPSSPLTNVVRTYVPTWYLPTQGYPGHERPIRGQKGGGGLRGEKPQDMREKAGQIYRICLVATSGG